MRRSSRNGLFVIVAMTLFLAGCASTPEGPRRGDRLVELAAADHDRPVDVKVGDTVVVRLDANRTTGYNWLLPEGYQAEKVLLPLHPTSRYDTNINGFYAMGVGGVEIWEFQAVNAGNVSLMLEYRRSFEPGIKPLKTLVFPVRVSR